MSSSASPVSRRALKFSLKSDASADSATPARFQGSTKQTADPIRNVEGVVEMMLDATRHFDQPLTQERLFAWHASLFHTGRSRMTKITTGAWREDSSGPMQVVSGPMGKEHVHFEAPTADRVSGEMGCFLDLFGRKDVIDPVLKAGLAHLWFVTIHPFDDGNGRIARAIADMALARSENSPQRFYSMSAQIRQERKVYYEILEHTQKGTMDVTPWMDWFLGCLGRAIDRTQETLGAVLAKAASGIASRACSSTSGSG